MVDCGDFKPSNLLRIQIVFSSAFYIASLDARVWSTQEKVSSQAAYAFWIFFLLIELINHLCTFRDLFLVCLVISLPSVRNLQTYFTGKQTSYYTKYRIKLLKEEDLVVKERNLFSLLPVLLIRMSYLNCTWTPLPKCLGKSYFMKQKCLILQTSKHQ